MRSSTTHSCRFLLLNRALSSQCRKLFAYADETKTKRSRCVKLKANCAAVREACTTLEAISGSPWRRLRLDAAWMNIEIRLRKLATVCSSRPRLSLVTSPSSTVIF